MDDSDLPFDDLDPCCQKEILNRRREREISLRLGETDPSAEKAKAIKKVFAAPAYSSCGTCCAPRDYALLQFCRLSLPSTEPREVSRERDAYSDESDSDLDIDDDYLSEKELEIRNMMLRKVTEAEAEKALKRSEGYCVHAEDTADHVAEIISRGENIVVHIYDSQLMSCAQLDLGLERFASEFTSTRFRRVPVMDSYLITSMHRVPSGKPVLCCFTGGNLVCCTDNIDELVPDGEIFSENLRRYLQMSRVLEDTYAPQHLIRKTAAESSDPENEDLNDEERFCDVKGCEKKYSHSHIGIEGSSGSIFGISNNSGQNALEKDYYLRF
jgi:hypothetical protein